MRKELNEYDNELVVGRIAKVEVAEDKVKLSIVENFDEKGDDVSPKWVNATAFKKTAENLANLDSKELLKGALIVVTLRVTQNGEYTNRSVNSFKIAKFPAKKES